MEKITRAPTRLPYSKRRSARLSVSGRVEVLWHAKELSCKMRNINADGALLSGEFGVEIGDVVRLIFKPLDIPTEMCLTSKVVHVAGTAISQFGIVFVDLPMRSKVMLGDYVIRHRASLLGRRASGVLIS